MAIPLQYDVFARDNASRTFDRVGNSISRTNRQASTLGRSFGVVGAAVRRAAVGAGAALGAMTVAGGTFGLKTAASLQQSQIAFETLLGSAKRARVFLDDLKKFAATTPFELPGLVDASRQLIGAGAAAKDVLPTLTAWGDASGALGLNQEQFGRIMLAVTQAMGKGKVQGEELRQITEAGVPVWSLLSRALGKPIPVLQELSREGKLLATDVFPALERQMGRDYGGAMGKQAKTLSGLWSTFKDTLNLGLADAIQPLVPILQSAMPGAIRAMGSALQGLGGILAQAIPAVQGFLGSVRDSSALQAFAGWITGSLWPALQGVAADLLPKLQAAWASISGTIRENSGTFRALGDIITQVVLPILGKIAGIVVDLIGPAFKGLVWMLKTVVIPVFALLTTSVLNSFRVILDAAAWAFGWVPEIGEKLKRAAADVGAFADKTNAELARIVRDVDVNVNVTPVVRPAVNSALHAPGFIGPTQAESLAARGVAGPYTPEQTGQAAVERAKRAAKKVAEAIGDGLAAGAPAVADGGKKVADAAKQRFDEIRQAAESLRDSVRTSVMGFFTLQSEGNPFRGLAGMAKKAVRFANALARLTRQGVHPSVVSMIAQAGPEVGLRAATMLSTASGKDRSRINRAYGTIEAAANRAANVVVGAQNADTLGVARRSEQHLAAIRKAVSGPRSRGALAAGWAAN